jgi:trafficking protein particle complex subunit 11
VNYISIDDERSTSLVRAVSFGTVEPGCSVTRTVTLASGGPGKRVLDFSIQSRVTDVPSAAGEENETLITVSVDTLEPFRQDTYITYSQPRENLPVFPEVTSFDNWDNYTAEAMVSLTLDCVADCKLEIIKFINIVSLSRPLICI